MKAIPWPECRGWWHRLWHSHKRHVTPSGIVWVCRGFTTVHLYLPAGRPEVVRLSRDVAGDTIELLVGMPANAHDALQALQSDGNQFIRIGDKEGPL